MRLLLSNSRESCVQAKFLLHLHLAMPGIHDGLEKQLRIGHLNIVGFALTTHKKVHGVLERGLLEGRIAGCCQPPGTATLGTCPEAEEFLMKIKYGGWIFLVICFLSIYRVYPLGKSVELVVFFVLSLILHELGHAITARYYRSPVHEVGLCLWGGYIRYERPSNALYQVVILASGMLTNLMLIVPFWFIPHIGPLVSVWNLFLFLLSVLPFRAFDGGKILRLCARRS